MAQGRGGGQEVDIVKSADESLAVGHGLKNNNTHSQGVQWTQSLAQTEKERVSMAVVVVDVWASAVVVVIVVAMVLKAVLAE